LFGLAFGSFLNVCISRLPRHESILRPGSRCPDCSTPILIRDNFPLLSWIALRGRCRACHRRIPWRYPAIEFATAALFLTCFLQFGLTLADVGMAVLSFLLLGLAVMDAETMRLPDAFTLPGLLLGIVYSGLLPEATMSAHLRAVGFALLWAVVAALILLLISGAYYLVRRRQGLGTGDIKLLAMIAAWLGPIPTLLTLTLGVFATAVYALLLVAASADRRAALTASLPFGSFLCAAALYALFRGEPIVHWYLQFFPK
jgi:leader peptidase (prepilin peptidase)/N-methyltransferase